MPPKQKNIEECNIKLQKFKMTKVGDNKVIVLIGARGRGKSTALIDYLYHNQDIPFATCIAPTDVFNFTFTPHIPSRFIFSDYTPELVSKFLSRQQKMKGQKMQAKMGLGGNYADVDCRGILIMDDCLAQNKGWTSDPGLKWVFFNGRHADITFVLTMQYQIGIPPAYRANIDWVFLFKENKRVEREKLWKYYAGIFPTFAMFEQIFMRCTTGRKCMVIEQLSGSENITDQVYWFQAAVRENFKMCYDEFWQKNDYYLKKRLAMNDPTGGFSIGNLANQAATQQSSVPDQDDYFKYVGGRGKVRFNLDMEDEEDGGATGYGDMSQPYRQSQGYSQSSYGSYGNGGYGQGYETSYGRQGGYSGYGY